jgi:hypothetical protein
MVDLEQEWSEALGAERFAQLRELLTDPGTSPSVRGQAAR